MAACHSRRFLLPSHLVGAAPAAYWRRLIRPFTLLKGRRLKTGRPGERSNHHSESRWTRIYIDDVYVRDAVVRSLSGAAEWLESAKCQSLLSEFTDLQERPLKERLGELGVTLGDYLRILVFEDGERRPRANRRACWRITSPTAASSGSAVERSSGPGSGNRRRAGPQSSTKCFIRSASARTRRPPDTSPIE